MHERIDCGLAADVGQRGYAKDAAARRVPVGRTKVFPEPVRIVDFLPHVLLDDTDAYRPRRDLVLERNDVVEVPGPFVFRIIREVVEAKRLFVGGDVQPTVVGLDVGGAGAIPHVDLRESAIDLFDRETAKLLRLVPDQSVDAGILLGNASGALRVPDTVGADLAGVDRNRGGSCRVDVPATQNPQSLQSAAEFAGLPLSRKQVVLVTLPLVDVENVRASDFVGPFQLL